MASMMVPISSTPNNIAPASMPSPMLDGQKGSLMSTAANQIVPTHQQQDAIKLSVIIERAVQTAYHELIVLAELLPRKPDVERKVELCKWCIKTRQMFVRVFALAKWVSGAAKVDRSAHVTEFLDNQANFFVMTANRLHTMAREDLANAKLPTFYIPHAVDVLSTGSYPRLPGIIRDKVIPPKSATKSEQSAALSKLNEVIPSVLFDSNIPKEFRRFTIKNGRVTFHVEDEFNVTLTLFGVESSLPWRVLNIEFLIRDDNVGEGRPLVHELQKNYLVGLIQSKLNSKEFQLSHVYHYLHKFCQYLRLEILHSQLLCSVLEQRNAFIGVETYKAGSHLTFFYWKDMKRILGRVIPLEKSIDKDSLSTFSISINLEENTGLFAVSHFPKIREDGVNATGFINPKTLNIPTLLSNTIHVRSQDALVALQQFLSKNSPTFPTTYNESVPNLSIQTLHPLDDCEIIKVSVQPKTGMFVVRCPKLTSQSCIELEISLNKENTNYIQKLDSIRKNFLLQRIHNSLYGLSCSIVENPSFAVSKSHPYTSLPDSKIFVQLENNSQSFVVVCVESVDGYLKPKYYMMQLFQPNTGVNSNSSEPDYKTVQIAALVPLNTDLCSQASYESEYELGSLMKKSSYSDQKFATERNVGAALPGLRETVSSCLMRFLANSVKDALKYCLPDAEVVASLCDGAPCFYVTKMPTYNLGSVRESSEATFKKCILSVEIRPRVQRNFRGVLGITYITCVGALKGSKKVSHLQSFLELNRWSNRSFFLVPLNKFEVQWKHMLKLYDEYLYVKEYIERLNEGFSCEKPWIEIVCYDVEKLVLAYGPGHCFTITFQSFLLDKSCQQTVSPDVVKSRITFGTKFPPCSKMESRNPHVGPVFESLVNAEYQRSETHILDLMYSLHITSRPLSLITSLNKQIQVGVSFCNRPTDLCHTSTNIIARSLTKLSLVFRFIFVLEIEFIEDSVLLSDGAVSQHSEDIPRSVSKSVYCPQKLDHLHWFVLSASRISTSRFASTPSIGMNVFSDSMMGSIPNPTMLSPEPFNTLSMDSSHMNVSLNSSNDFSAFPLCPGGSESDSFLGSGKSLQDSSKSMNSPKFVTQDSHSDNSAASFLPNSPIKMTYKTFAKILERCVVCNGSEDGFENLSILELYLTWTFIKWDVLNQLKDVSPHDGHTLKLDNLSGIVFIFGISSDFMGMTMKFEQSPKLRSSNMDGEDVTSLSSDSLSLLSPDDVALLQRYFQQKIAVQPFRASLFLAWCTFLLLPPHVISDCASILRFELNSSERHRWTVKVLWVLPLEQISNVSVTKIGVTGIRRSQSDSVVLFLVCECKASGRKLDLPLSYNWKSKVINPAISNCLFDQPLAEAAQSISQEGDLNKQRYFLSSCICHALTVAM